MPVGPEWLPPDDLLPLPSLSPPRKSPPAAAAAATPKPKFTKTPSSSSSIPPELRKDWIEANKEDQDAADALFAAHNAERSAPPRTEADEAAAAAAAAAFELHLRRKESPLVCSDAEVRRLMAADGGRTTRLQRLHPVVELDRTFLYTENGAHAYLIRSADGTWREDPYGISASTLARRGEAFDPAAKGFNMLRATTLGTEFHRFVEEFYNSPDENERLYSMGGFEYSAQTGTFVRMDGTITPDRSRLSKAFLAVYDAQCSRKGELDERCVEVQLAYALSVMGKFLDEAHAPSKPKPDPPMLTTYAWMKRLLHRRNVWRTELSMSLLYHDPAKILKRDLAMLSGQIDAVFADPAYAENKPFFDFDAAQTPDATRPYPRRVVIVDWKTTNGQMSDALANNYRRQLMLYKHMLENLLTDVVVTKLVMVCVPKNHKMGEKLEFKTVWSIDVEGPAAYWRECKPYVDAVLSEIARLLPQLRREETATRSSVAAQPLTLVAAPAPVHALPHWKNVVPAYAKRF